MRAVIGRSIVALLALSLMGAPALRAQAQTSDTAAPAQAEPAASGDAPTPAPAGAAPADEAAPAAPPPAEPAPAEAVQGAAAAAAPESTAAVAAQLEPSAATAETPVVSPTASNPPPPSPIEEISEDAPRWFARLTWDQTYNTAGFTRGDEPSFNPEYAWLFLGEVGYKPDQLTTLYARQDMALELTDSDSTTRSQEVQFADTIAEVWRTFLDEDLKPQQFVLAGRAGLSFPVSKASQAASVIATSRLRLDARIGWPEVVRGLGLGASGRYYHRFATSNVPHAETPFPCDVLGTDVSLSCSQLPGSSTVRDIFALLFDAELNLTRELQVGALFLLEWDLAHGLASETFEPESGGMVTLDDEGTHWRNGRVIELWFGYEFTDWFSGRAHVTNSFAERGPEAELRAPFNALDTVLGLELTVSFDTLHRQAQSHGGSR